MAQETGKQLLAFHIPLSGDVALSMTEAAVWLGAGPLETNLTDEVLPRVFAGAVLGGRLRRHF